mgnify:CR=1 FL=1
MQVWLIGALVFFAMPFEYDASCRFKLACLALKIGTDAALGFGGVAGKLHAVDGEHRA